MADGGISAARSGHTAEENEPQMDISNGDENSRVLTMGEPEQMDDFEMNIPEAHVTVSTSFAGDDSAVSNADVEAATWQNGEGDEDGIEGEDDMRVDNAIVVTEIDENRELEGETGKIEKDNESEHIREGGATVHEDQQLEKEGEHVEDKHEIVVYEGEEEDVGEKDEGDEGEEDVGKAPGDVARVKYETDDRYNERVRGISGDFRQKGISNVFAPVTSFASFLSYASGEQIDAESSPTETDSEMSYVSQAIDRTPYLDLFETLKAAYPMIKLKNNYLQRKMAEYFQKRKMDRHLRELDSTDDTEPKYFRLLDDLWELRNLNNAKRNVIAADLCEKKLVRDKQVQSANNNFDAMLNREEAVGTGLVYTKTGHPLPEKLLDRLLRNQRAKYKEIHDMRLTFIKATNSIAEISEATKAMDKIGKEFTLFDYKQLKGANQTLVEKIEERDAELLKLRLKCESATQALAHHREKAAFTSILILKVADELDDIEIEKCDLREYVGTVKHERDCVRTKIRKLHDNSGMLLNNKLLLDMYDTMNEVAAHKEELANTKLMHLQNQKSLLAIKQNLAQAQRHFHARESSVKPKRKKVTAVHEKLSFPQLDTFKVFNKKI